MKDILLKIIDSDKSYNKNAIKYLYKSYPDLWKQVIDATSFLPVDAKPKQRIWHILNETYEIPKCPETGLEVKWNENRYLTFINGSAKASYQNKLGIYNNHNKDSNQKRSTTVKTNYRNGKHILMQDRNLNKDNTKTKQTCLERYGVNNIFKDKNFIEQNYLKGVASGKITPREKRDDKRKYYDAVAYYTKKSWYEHFSKINPEQIKRGDNWHLDHIYSRQQGFANNIPPYIIGHWTNLRIISKSDNSAKSSRCDKTQEKLYEDFFNENIDY